MQSQQSNVFKVFIGKCAVERRINGIAPMGYGITVVGLSTRHWGYGGEKSTEAMMAHGLIRAANVVFIECDDPIIAVVTPATGTQRYLTEFAPRWLADGAPSVSKDSFETWRKLLALAALGNLTMRKPEDKEEKKLAKAMQVLSKLAANEAFREFTNIPSRFAQAGVLVTDEDPGAPTISMG